MKKTVAILLTLVMVLLLAASCSKNADTDTSAADTTAADVAAEGSTQSAKLMAIFKAEAANTTDVKAIADKLADFEGDAAAYTVETKEEGFLNGFDGDVTGFKACASISPWIGSIPFAVYVFEADDAEAFLETIKAQANPAWNICTEATDVASCIEGNLVFFAMCPGEDEGMEDDGDVELFDEITVADGEVDIPPEITVAE